MIDRGLASFQEINIATPFKRHYYDGNTVFEHDEFGTIVKRSVNVVQGKAFDVFDLCHVFG